MKHILLPTDFSSNAFNAVVYALQLFKEEECHFYLLHTYTPVLVSSGSMLDSYSALVLQQTAHENAQKRLDALEIKIHDDFKNPRHQFTTMASFNMLVPEMDDVVQHYKIDVVIMGTQGATGAKEVFLGTQTMFAIKRLKCPVIAVPSAFTYHAPKEILFPTDFTLNKDNKFLALLKRICTLHLSTLHVLNAYHGTPLTASQLEKKTFLNSYFEDHALHFHLAENTDVLGAVEQFQAGHPINFMVMIHNKHNFMENMLFKPVINQIVYHTQVPFLVIPAVERQ